MGAQNTIELDLECYKALESHRQSLDETPLDILRRILLSADSNRHPRSVEPDGSAPDPGEGLTGRGPSSGASGWAGFPSDRRHAPVPSDWQDPNDETERRTGHYLVQMGDRACFAASQKAAYRLALIWLEKTSPGLLDRLADAGTRNRRIVAPSPGALYPRSPALAKHAEKLVDGWYVDVNLSKEQKLSRLKTACRLAGVMFGKDLIVEL
ncbi:MAG: hypothetical protein U9P68_15100 [Pseudomonadota bacterium]|nr:hypothetical protein [Pseudomonadota bacterium]